MTVKEWLDSHNYEVSKIIWTHVGETELEEPVVLYDENDVSSREE